MAEDEKDLLDALREEHDRLWDHLDTLQGTEDAGERRRVLQRVRDELRGHLDAEDDEVLPALLHAADDGSDAGVVVNALREEHDLIHHVLRDLASNPDTGGARFSGQVEVLRDLVDQHLHREEEELASLVEEHLDEEARRTLGRRLQQVRGQQVGLAA